MKIKSLIILLFFTVFCKAQQFTLETALNSTVNETSGLLYLNNTLITHNDSANTNQLFEIDTATGEVTRTVTITNATNVDWEDLTYDDTYIYIGDFGNNAGDRTDLKIYRITIADYFASTSVTADVINYDYSNQTNFTPSPFATNFDAEGLIHYNNQLYIFSKNWLDGNTNIYVIPKTPGTYSTSIVDTINAEGLISGATYNNLDNSIVLCGYDGDGAFLIQLSAFNSGLFSNGSILKSSLTVPTNYSVQIEGVTSISASEYYVTAENNTQGLAGLYSFDFSTLSVADFIKDLIAFYPNPAKDKIFINKANCITKIYSITGKLVRTSINQIIDISDFTSGIYILTLKHSESLNSTVKKLVVQ